MSTLHSSWGGSSCSSGTKLDRRCARTPRSTQAAALSGRHSSLCSLQHQQQQPCLQHLAAASLPRQQLCPQQHSLRDTHQQQQQQLRSRCSVLVAAGRRRRQTVDTPQVEEPDLDMDDVMYAGDGAGDDVDEEAVLQADAGADEFEEYEEDEEDEEEEFDEGDEDEVEPAAQGDDDWAAALDQFDTSLDAQAVEQGPSKEEQELAAAKALVRFNEGGAELDGTSLIVTEEPPEQPDRPKTFEEQTVALSPEDKQTLEQNMASYTVFPLHEVDLLVSSNAAGQLVLSDCFCLNTVEESFLRPFVGEGVPSAPGLYQVIPWEHTKSGDVLRHKEPEVSRMKLYFIGLHSSSPHEVDMSRVFSFDVDNMSMVSHTPKVLGADSQEDLVEPVMRIREDGVWIEEAAELPGVFFIAEGFAGHPEDRYLNPDKEFDIFEFVKMGLWDKPRSMEELQALEAAAAAAGPTKALAAAAGPGPEAALVAGAAAGPGAAAAAGAAAGQEEASVLDSQMEHQIEERLEELELMEELDDMPDVPAIDMM